MVWQPRPGTQVARILDHIRGHPEGVTDSEIRQFMGPQMLHQEVNRYCHYLQDRGVVVRHQTGSGIKRVAVKAEGGTTVSPPPAPKPPPTPVLPGDEPDHSWHWEGNVQAAAVQILASEGWMIRRVADTASKEPGKDIHAERDGSVLWVTVKGYYEGPNRAIAGNWARHSFEAAMLDVILWRQGDSSVSIAVALPSMTTYRNLAGRVDWFQRAADFAFLWVTAQGASWS